MTGASPAAAGTRENGVLTVRLVTRLARWSPDELDTPPLDVYAFAEEREAPRIPGPMIRARQGEQVQVVLRNTLERPLFVHGLQPRPATAEAVHRVGAGETADISFDAGAPGTYLYWASADSAVDSLVKRERLDSQLNGVIVVDAAGAAAAEEEVMVISTAYFPPDTSVVPRIPERFIVALNGRHWPHTERYSYGQGDSVRWRWVNASFEPHPMHLHGFFFRITSSGTPLADTLLPAEASRLAVTENLLEGESRGIVWVPERPGNWLMHCHLQWHVDPAVTAYVPAGWPGPHHSGNHAVDAMKGLAIGVSVRQRGPSVATPDVSRRVIRMELSRLPPGGRTRVAVALRDSANGLAGVPSSPGATLLLRTGEPARIWIVNRLDEPSAVHWHGLELDSYFDGVSGFSGEGRRLAPLIAPGDSFAADITPVRPGTYIYHSHVEDTHQRGDGLYGALIVLDRTERWDAARNPIFLLGGRELQDTLPPMLNGSTSPPPLQLVAGQAYRLRLINIMEVNGPVMQLVRGGAPVQWRAVARDAVPLPAALAVSGPAVVDTEVGMTFDYELVPQAGEYRFEVRRSSGALLNTQVLQVSRAR